MTIQRTTTRYCDRCVRSNAAIETVKLGYDGNEYEIDVCRQHAEMLDRDMRGWTRLAREIEAPKSSLSLTDGERAFLRRPAAAPPAKPKVIDLDAPAEINLNDLVDTISDDEPEPIEVWPTQAAYDAMVKNSVDWPSVVAIVRHPSAVVPSQQDGIDRYLGREIEVLVSEDKHVLGLRRREVDRSATAATPQGPKKIVRKGKRGGIGNVGPRTHQDLLDAIRKTPGWKLEMGGKHYKVLGPEGQVSTLPITPSDYRGTLNAVSELRALGLDLRAQTQQSA